MVSPFVNRPFFCFISPIDFYWRAATFLFWCPASEDLNSTQALQLHWFHWQRQTTDSSPTSTANCDPLQNSFHPKLQIYSFEWQNIDNDLWILTMATMGWLPVIVSEHNYYLIPLMFVFLSGQLQQPVFEKDFAKYALGPVSECSWYFCTFSLVYGI